MVTEYGLAGILQAIGTAAMRTLDGGGKIWLGQIGRACAMHSPLADFRYVRRRAVAAVRRTVSLTVLLVLLVQELLVELLLLLLLLRR